MENIRLFIDEKKKIIDSLSLENASVLPQLLKVLKHEFAYFLNAIDGSNLSKAETSQVIETEQAVGGKSLAEQNQALIYANTAEWLFKASRSSKNDISEQQIISLHQLQFLIKNTETEMLRYAFKVPYVLTEYSEWLQQQNGDILDTAVDAGVKLLQCKVFDDQTARTSLLVTNVVLLQAGYPLIFITKNESAQWHEAVKKIERGGSNNEYTDILHGAIDRSLDICLEVLHKKESGSEETWLKIGELAKLTNESISTIRHWTKTGLLKVAGYSKGGYQLYDPGMGEVVVKIREFQKTERRTVSEVKKILDGSI